MLSGQPQPHPSIALAWSYGIIRKGRRDSWGRLERQVQAKGPGPVGALSQGQQGGTTQPFLHPAPTPFPSLTLLSPSLYTFPAGWQSPIYKDDRNFIGHDS